MNKSIYILLSLMLLFSAYVYSDYNNALTCSMLSSGFCPSAYFQQLTILNITSVNYNVTNQICLNNSCINSWSNISSDTSNLMNINGSNSATSVNFNGNITASTLALRNQSGTEKFHMYYDSNDTLVFDLWT